MGGMGVRCVTVWRVSVRRVSVRAMAVRRVCVRAVAVRAVGVVFVPPPPTLEPWFLLLLFLSPVLPLFHSGIAQTPEVVGQRLVMVSARAAKNVALGSRAEDVVADDELRRRQCHCVQ